MGSFKQYILNEMFGSFKYIVPEDKEQQLFDFYMYCYLNKRSSLEIRQNINNYNDNYRKFSDEEEMDAEQEVDYMLGEIGKKLLPQLKTELLNVVFYALCSEFRHIFDKNKVVEDITSELESKDSIELFKTYAKNFRDELEDPKSNEDNAKKSFYAVEKSSDNEYSFVQLMLYLFGIKYLWFVDYGGEAWANICRGWLSLYRAKDVANQIIYIDHIYDLQHNTDTVFNKIKSYMQNGTYSWLKKALDFKRDIKNPQEIIERVSPLMRKLAQRAIYIKTGISWEDFNKKQGGRSVYVIMARLEEYLENKDFDFTNMEKEIIKNNITPELLTKISKDPEWSYHYAKDILNGKNVPKIILQGLSISSWNSWYYALDVLKWKEVPPEVVRGFSKKPECAFKYAKYGLKGIDVPEEVINGLSKKPEYAFEYARDVLKWKMPLPPEIVKGFSQDPYLADLYQKKFAIILKH